MNTKHLIVVSAENNPYMAWQSKLFHFSCVTRLEAAPVIVVHETGAKELHRDFHEIEKTGGRVLRAPSYKLSARGDVYPPRNTAGTLLHAAERFGTECDFLILCDPDMIFARRAKFPETLAGDYCSYIKYDRDFVDEARQALRISREELDDEQESLRCGVPYVIPVGEAMRLAEMWLEAIDSFPPPRRWEDVMHAFGLAAVRLKLKVRLTRLAQSNYWPDAILERDVVHYCYGDSAWSKRHYFREEQAPAVWRSRVESREGTVLREIISQILEAEEFYSASKFETAPASQSL